MAKQQTSARRSTPQNGMQPSELARLGKKIYGDGWWLSMAADLGVDRVTVWRWATGRSTISVPTAIAIRARADAKKKRRRGAAA